METRPRAQFLPIRTSQPVNNLYIFWLNKNEMNWTERLAKIWNLGNAKLQKRNCKLRFAVCGLRFAVCLMLKISITCETHRIDSQSVTSILCVSQVMSQKVVAVILQMHVLSPLPTQYNVERSKELCFDGFNTLRGVGVGGRNVQC